MDLVVSWGLSDREITLEILWTNFKDFSDLLNSFR